MFGCLKCKYKNCIFICWRLILRMLLLWPALLICQHFLFQWCIQARSKCHPRPNRWRQNIVSKQTIPCSSWVHQKASHWCTDLFMCDTVHTRGYNVKSHWKVQGRNFTPEKRLESLKYCRTKTFHNRKFLWFLTSGNSCASQIIKRLHSGNEEIFTNSANV